MSLFDQFDWDGTRAFPFWWSAYWLGPTNIPPITMQLGLTDRDAGAKVWYPFVTADGKHIQFTDQKPAGPIRVYAPFDGPWVGQSGMRIGIMSGHVVVDVPPGSPNMAPGPFFRGVGNNLLAAVLFPTSYPVIGAGGGVFYDHIGFQSDNVKGGIFDPTP